MEAILLKLINMSMVANYIVISIVFLRLYCRFFFKSAPKWIICASWLFVGVRLVCPFSIESSLSDMPGEVIPSGILVTRQGAIDSGVDFVNGGRYSMLADALTPKPTQGVTPMQIVSVVWIVGITLMLAYALVSTLRLRLRLREGVRLHDNIYICDHIPVPFVLGIFRPRIYLPSSLRPADAEYVIAHERAHLRRRDHIWKWIAYLLLTVYWFNPFIWLAYILLCRDIEFACDERVIRELGEQVKQPYAVALINCSIRRHTGLAYPLAFGEVGVKARVKNVLNYKKPILAVTVALAVILIIGGVSWLTDPPADVMGVDSDVASSVRAALDEAHVGYTELKSPSRFLSGEVRALRTADDSTVIFYVYENPDAAADDAQNVSSDGLSVTVPDGEQKRTYSIDWVSEPRWYLWRDTVVCYIGTDGNVITALGELCGAPFAGVC